LASVAPEAPLLLDARLRFPVHALPDERVVWVGIAVGVAYIAAMLANAIELWGLPENDPTLSQLLNVWLPRSRG